MDNKTITSICRTCLSESGEFKSVFVYDDNSDYMIHLSEMITACASIQITVGDGLPEQICLECADQTVKMYLFKLKCEVSDKTLRERLQRSPIQEICNIREKTYSKYLEMNDYNGTNLNATIKSEITIDEPHEGDLIDDKSQATFGFYETENNDNGSENPVLVCNELSNKKEKYSEYMDRNGCTGTDLSGTIKSEIIIDESHESDVLDDKTQATFGLNETKNIGSDIENPVLGSNALCKNEFKCEFCNSTLCNQSALNRHMRTIHKIHPAIKVFECRTCNKRFRRKHDLLRHKISHEKKMESDDFNVNDDFEDNTIIKRTETELYLYRECGVPFQKKKEMEMHVKQHKVNSNISCHGCIKEFSRQVHLNRHLRTHCKPHICSICNKGFFKLEQLTNHMILHSGVKRHICDICFKGFNQSSNLIDHRRIHNGEKPFLCSTCHKGFNQLGNLRQHQDRHNGIKAYWCSTCGYGFASKGELSSHLRKHTGARPYVCPICSHGFTTIGSLAAHKRIHSGEKPYECEVCKVKFSRLGILVRHKRTHTGEKPYGCNFCAKAFCQSNDLTSHLRIHTGEKPYICDVCGQAFRQSTALKTHKKTHLISNNIEGMGVHGDGANRAAF